MKTTMNDFVFGSKVVEYLLQYHPKLIKKICLKKNHRLFQAIEKKQIPYFFWDYHQFNRNVGEHNHQLIVAFIHPYQYYPFAKLVKNLSDYEGENRLFLILDHIKDAYNFGSILRTAKAVGVDAVIIANFNQAPINAVCIKAAMGSVFDLKIVCVANLTDTIIKLKKLNVWILSSSIQGNHYRPKVNVEKMNLGLILGNEDKGVSRILEKNADFIIKLPMVNFNSLNVSNAAAVFMYQIRDWQNFWNITIKSKS